ncbi:MAG TPA: hypothetical protein VGP24_02505 [Glaciihabitans sp.]|nr:hypothetical protein [Glaciihabitans sp.]
MFTSAKSTADNKRPWATETREIVAVFVLSATAILTAWCGFESSKWSGQMSIAFSEASASRIKASDASSETRDARAVDLAIYSLWIDARASGDAQLEAYVSTRFTPAFAIAFEAWQEDGEALNSPFADPSYVPAGLIESEEFTRTADHKFADALMSNQRSDNYSLLTVFFALVLFFSAMSNRATSPRVGWILLGLAIALAAIGAIIVATFPVLL